MNLPEILKHPRLVYLDRELIYAGGKYLVRKRVGLTEFKTLIETGDFEKAMEKLVGRKK